MNDNGHLRPIHANDPRCQENAKSLAKQLDANDAFQTPNGVKP